MKLEQRINDLEIVVARLTEDCRDYNYHSSCDMRSDVSEEEERIVANSRNKPMDKELTYFKCDEDDEEDGMESRPATCGDCANIGDVFVEGLYRPIYQCRIFNTLVARNSPACHENYIHKSYRPMIYEEKTEVESDELKTNP